MVPGEKQRNRAVEVVTMFTSVVLPIDAWSSACCTSFSDSESSALVASSSKSIAGFLMTARAMAIRCFWPPDSSAPRSPICKGRACNHRASDTGIGSK
uniref:Uncharacterized protein n=1 Tax=Oryza glumipatula TaxID=40148 RepID=A0A0D9YED5_9ORYZ